MIVRLRSQTGRFLVIGRVICCWAGATAIATLVERTSRYAQLVALPDGCRAGPVRQALAASVRTLPTQLARSLTWDQGHDMAEHAQLTVATGLQVYFCDPNSPWQRATNENTNGRQYFPARKRIRSTRQTSTRATLLSHKIIVRSSSPRAPLNRSDLADIRTNLRSGHYVGRFRRADGLLIAHDRAPSISQNHR